MSVDSTVQFLWDAANIFKAETHAHQLLKSYYMNSCRKIAKDALQMPKEKFAPSKMCQHCSCFWKENEYTLKLQPQKAPCNSKTKKLIEKLELARANNTRGLITGKKRKRAKWLQKRITNRLQIMCKFCQHSTFLPLEKKAKVLKGQESKQQEESIAIVSVESAQKKSKKRKKLKTKNAGLKIPAAAPDTTSIKPKKQKIQASSAKASVVSKSPVTSKKAPSSTQLLAKEKKQINLSRPMSASKNKKQAKNKNIKTPTAMPSKTQQQNSLLQLAALLKVNEQKSAASRANTIESLLK